MDHGMQERPKREQAKISEQNQPYPDPSLEHWYTLNSRCFPSQRPGEGLILHLSVTGYTVCWMGWECGSLTRVDVVPQALSAIVGEGSKQKPQKLTPAIARLVKEPGGHQQHLLGHISLFAFFQTGVLPQPLQIHEPLLPGLPRTPNATDVQDISIKFYLYDIAFAYNLYPRCICTLYICLLVYLLCVFHRAGDQTPEPCSC